MKGLIGALSVLLVVCVAALGALLYYHYRPASPPATSAPMAANRPPADDSSYDFTVLDPPRPAPGIAFATRAGEAKSLADFRGRVLLVNLWATWCGPCIEEMPSLDRLQARLGSRLAVLAISEDRRGSEAVEPFLKKIGLKNLAIYLDVRNTAARAFGIEGLPTSYLIDREGRIRVRVEGAADWDSPGMLARLEPYLRQGPAGPELRRTSYSQ
jgi:thiol-disulfide isomerase/thioredoxin